MMKEEAIALRWARATATVPREAIGPSREMWVCDA